MSLASPILFIVFNRPQTTAKVFEAIKLARPSKLYLAADGPRQNNNNDALNCSTVKNIIHAVDWPCEVKTLYQTENLGSKKGVLAAINWFFHEEEEGIILEDDCLPAPEFFHFCDILLHRYRHDDRVMHIGGTNLQFGQFRGDASYYFSRISSIWGWASWRRVWQLCDHEMSKFPIFEQQDQMINCFPDRKIADWVTAMARMVYEGKVETWDYPMAFSIACNNGLCVSPNFNLISNIGFGAGATRTTDATSIHADIPVAHLGDITHPIFFIPDIDADLFQLSLSVLDIKVNQIAKATEYAKSTRR
jgi:hypothetical protein